MAPFRNLGQTPTGNLVTGYLGDIFAGKKNVAAAHPGLAEDAHQQGGFTGTIGTDKGHNLALVDIDRHIAQGLYRAVIGIHIFDLENRAHAGFTPFVTVSSTPK
ncbi:hypothetical protein GALL_438310 [mine drainage metagenome]|uniref:Uncharacterized protein n=1 Tax=mine drainage metagenome TaxID=410659 RepID=A0A1J5PSE4_9ZZZZ